MKEHLLYIVTLILLAASGHAQVIYIDTSDAGRLKSTTTLFVIPAGDSILARDFEYAIRSVWHFNSFRIIKAQELANYVDRPGYSFFCALCTGTMNQDLSPNYIGPYNNTGLGGLAAVILVNVAANALRTATDNHLYYGQSEEGRLFGTGPGFYSIYSFFTQETNRYGQKMLNESAIIKMGLACGNELMREKSTRAGAELGPYQNVRWSPGLLKVYLTMISNALETGAGTLQFVNFVDTVHVKRLASDTLYIPDYHVGFILKSADQEDSSRIDSVIASVYPFPYRIVSSRELSELLLRAMHPVRFLSYSTYDNIDIASAQAERKNAPEKLPTTHLDRGIKVYDSDKGVIYADFPHKHFFFKRASLLTSFSVEDLEDLAAVVKASEAR